MKANRARLLGKLLVFFGLLIVVLSPKIVFPCLEVLFGIETIVGKDNVVYSADGGYVFTNPLAMIHWILGVAIIGVGIGSMGIGLLWKSRNPKPEP